MITDLVVTVYIDIYSLRIDVIEERQTELQIFLS